MSLLPKPCGMVTLDDFSGRESSTTSRPSHCGVIFSFVRMVKTHTNLGSGLEQTILTERNEQFLVNNTDFMLFYPVLMFYFLFS